MVTENSQRKGQYHTLGHIFSLLCLESGSYFTQGVLVIVYSIIEVLVFSLKVKLIADLLENHVQIIFSLQTLPQNLPNKCELVRSVQ